MLQARDQLDRALTDATQVQLATVLDKRSAETARFDEHASTLLAAGSVLSRETRPDAMFTQESARQDEAASSIANIRRRVRNCRDREQYLSVSPSRLQSAVSFC